MQGASREFVSLHLMLVLYLFRCLFVSMFQLIFRQVGCSPKAVE